MPFRFLKTMVERDLRRGFTARHALVLIVTVTVGVTIAAGVVIWLVDGSAYSSVGAGLWWALQTVTTVGYGDNLPDNRPGYAVAAVVMLTGIAFLTIATASITATFVEMARRRMAGRAAQPTDPVARELAELRQELAELRRELRPPEE